MNIKYRLQTWAADRFDSVQYPHIRQIREDQPTPKINFGEALGLLVIGGAAVVIGLLALAFGLLFLFS